MPIQERIHYECDACAFSTTDRDAAMAHDLSHVQDVLRADEVGQLLEQINRRLAPAEITIVQSKSNPELAWHHRGHYLCDAVDWEEESGMGYRTIVWTVFSPTCQKIAHGQEVDDHKLLVDPLREILRWLRRIESGDPLAIYAPVMPPWPPDAADLRCTMPDALPENVNRSLACMTQAISIMAAQVALSTHCELSYYASADLSKLTPDLRDYGTRAMCLVELARRVGLDPDHGAVWVRDHDEWVNGWRLRCADGSWLFATLPGETQAPGAVVPRRVKVPGIDIDDPLLALALALTITAR